MFSFYVFHELDDLYGSYLLFIISFFLCDFVFDFWKLFSWFPCLHIWRVASDIGVSFFLDGTFTGFYFVFHVQVDWILFYLTFLMTLQV